MEVGSQPMQAMGTQEAGDGVSAVEEGAQEGINSAEVPRQPTCQSVGKGGVLLLPECADDIPCVNAHGALELAEPIGSTGIHEGILP